MSWFQRWLGVALVLVAAPAGFGARFAADATVAALERRAERRAEEERWMADACVPTELELGAPIEGDLGDADCTSTRRFGAPRVDHYAFQATAGQTIRAEMRSEFLADLRLLGSDGRVIVQSAERLRDASLQRDLPADGRYTLEARAHAADGRGAYTLAVLDICAPIPITVGTSVDGRLEDAHCVSSRRPGSRARNYAFSARRNQTVTIALNGAFDTYLVLLDPDGRIVAENDDSGGNRHARIQMRLPADGIYRVEASAFLSSVRSGAYTLEVGVPSAASRTTTAAAGAPAAAPAAAAAAGCAATAIGYGASISGRLENADCASTRRRGQRADLYTFRGAAGESVTISLSAAFDTYLILVGPDGRILVEDDDGGTNTNSRIQVRLPRDGTYVVEATAYERPGSGPYTLDLASARPASSPTAAGGRGPAAAGAPAAPAPIAGAVVLSTAQLTASARYPFTVIAGEIATGPDTTVTVAPPADGRLIVRAPEVFLDLVIPVTPGQRVELPAAVPLRVGVNRGDCVASINGTPVREALPSNVRIVPGTYQVAFTCDGLGKRWEETFTVTPNPQQLQTVIGRVP